MMLRRSLHDVARLNGFLDLVRLPSDLHPELAVQIHFMY